MEFQMTSCQAGCHKTIQAKADGVIKAKIGPYNNTKWVQICQNMMAKELTAMDSLQTSNGGAFDCTPSTIKKAIISILIKELTKEKV